MDHDADRKAERAVRALLVIASGDDPPETDLLAGVRRRVARRRVRRRLLAASLATLSTASAIAVVSLLVPVGTGTPSAQARVAAAAGRTSTEGYRVRIEYSAADQGGAKAGEKWSMTEGVFDPARQTGRLRLSHQGLEIRFVGGMVYMELPAALRPRGKRWLSQRHRLDLHLDAPALARLTKLAWQDPQRELARLRSAADARELGPVAGDGWSGHRYAFELATGKNVVPSRVTGTVDVDQAGRVRRLEVVPQRTGATRVVMEFRDYGARETVLAPPASQVVPAIEWKPGETRP